MISVIIPAYNEEGNVIPLYIRLRAVLDGIGDTWEIVFVDDGGTDKTLINLRNLVEKDNRVKIIEFARNFGKAAALSAGFENSKGNIIITMDSDLQDDPIEIPRLLEKLKYYDLVVGWKHQRKDPITKKIASKIFNWLIRLTTKIKLHDSDCNFRIMRREVIENLNIYGGLFRYIPSLAYWKGFKVGEVKVRHNKRFSGKTKFKGIMRLIKGFLDLITINYLINYRTSPLYFFGFIGMGFSFLGILSGFYLLYLKYFLGLLIGNRPLLFLTILLVLLGVQFIFFGILGEMVINTQKEKNYRIRRIL